MGNRARTISVLTAWVGLAIVAEPASIDGAQPARNGMDMAIAGFLAAVGVCPGTGDCCTGNFTPGCDQELCCNTICGADQFCCALTWDEFCVQQAIEICGGP